MPDGPYKVLLIDGSASLASKIKSLLAQGTEVHFELESADPLAASVERLTKPGIDVVLVAASREEKQGLEALTQIAGKASATPVVMLGDDDDRFALEALGAGAQDYLAKDRMDSESVTRVLLRAIKRKRASEEQKQLRRQLISALAHDIQNPLVVINVNAQVLASQIQPSEEAHQTLDLLQLIQDNVRRINFLIKSFLDISKSEVVTVEGVRKPVQINHVVREICHHQVGELTLREIILKLDLDKKLPQIMGDESQLERALWNLVSNAIKYTPSGGCVTLSSYVDGQSVCVSVTDTGVGIPEDDLTSIFAEFYRHRDATPFRGIGLGLFIVKIIVQSHGGRVDVQSRVGEGSTFTVRLPLQGD